MKPKTPDYELGLLFIKERKQESHIPKKTIPKRATKKSNKYIITTDENNNTLILPQ